MLIDLKICAISVLSFSGPVCAPDKATLKCTNAGPYNAIPSKLLGDCSVCGLGPVLVGIHSIGLAARYRVAACSTTLRQGLEKIQTARGHKCAPISALSPVWEKEFLAPSMACSTANAVNIVCRLIVMSNFTKLRRIRSRKLTLDYSEANYMSRTLLGPSLYGPPKFWDRSVVIELRTSCPK